MATFYYTGYTREGKSIKGSKEATSKQALLQELTKSGILINSITESSQQKRQYSTIMGLITPKQNLADIFFQLSLLLRSGIPLVDGLRIIREGLKSAKVSDALMDVASKVSEGMRFSEALGKHPEIFDLMYVNLIKASEQVGHLAQVLMDIATYEENKKKNSDKLTSAMVYPLTILVIGMGVLGFLMAVIVPKMQGIFASVKKEIPASTKALLATANFLQKYGVVLLVVTLVTVIVLRYLYKNHVKFRLNMDKRLYNINAVAQVSISRFCHILAFQLKEGLPLSDALHFAGASLSNRYLQDIISKIRVQVQSGVKFSKAVRDAGVFPELFPAAVSTGESSGNMPELLERVSAFYDKKVEKQVSSFMSMIEPLFIVVMGILVGFVVLSIMQPMFDINTMVQ